MALNIFFVLILIQQTDQFARTIISDLLHILGVLEIVSYDHMIRYGWFYWFRLEEMYVTNIGYFVDYRFPRCFWVANLTYISKWFVSGFSSLGLGALKHVSRLVTEPVKLGFRMSFHSEDPVIEYTSVGFVFFLIHTV